MIAPLLNRLLAPRPLSDRETRAVVATLLSKESTDIERAGVLVALASRSPTAAELTGFIREMQRRALPFPIPPGDRPIDLCGSGGARTGSFNVSTVSAFVVAASGIPVLKHGNRSARGPCGSRDLLEALGLPVTTSLGFARATYRRVRLAFLHAPLYHPATRAVVAVRKVLAIPTLFNQLGPLSNPAPVAYQLLGVPDAPAARRAIEVLRRLGRRRAMAVTSVEGCDEFSPKRETIAFLWTGRRVYRRTVDARQVLPPEDRRGSWGPLPAEAAAEEARRILAGGGGARRGSVLLTAGAAVWLAGGARRLGDGIRTAREALDSGKAEEILEEMTRIAARFRSHGEV